MKFDRWDHPGGCLEEWDAGGRYCHGQSSSRANIDPGSAQGAGKTQRWHLMGVSHDHTSLGSLDGLGLCVGTRSAPSRNDGLSEAWYKGWCGGWG